MNGPAPSGSGSSTLHGSVNCISSSEKPAIIGCMGLTYIDATLSGPSGRKLKSRFLVDSGAMYTLVVESDWKQLGLKAKRRMPFTLADGTTIERDISECHIELPQGEGHTPVILGEAGDEPLLGAVTLEELGLVLNPFSRTLQPMRAMLA